ncbi:lipase family protein [Microbacterium hominis]|uniref:Serine aminopeptidase S33 domain-containing protein n=1 Tax=Microbacterium hominis TaxID=162426 RepID=A0A0B4DRR3_9MICO|nr:lipase family protein [Microbacterium hominis]KIC56968.1 hypothetical protein RM52_11920 [Microbacterium hominis]
MCTVPQSCPLLDRGYAIAATDYVGMGTAGPDSYLVGDTGGNAVLDAVRAAQHIEDVHASDRVVLWGHSQGGQFVADERTLGVDVEFHSINDADHGTVAYLALPALMAWLDSHRL